MEGRYDAGDPGQAGGDLVTGRWWRRNWWGLVALLPALALAFYAPIKDFYHQYWFDKPHQPVNSTRGGWVDYADARMRLISLSPVDDVEDYSGKPVTFPGGARVWHGTLELAAQNPDDMYGCRVSLESSGGSTFQNDPSELGQVDADLRDQGCAPDILAKPAPGAAYRTNVYFLLPDTARPVAVRITFETQLPRYARLTPP